jgi:hypothetical protein
MDEWLTSFAVLIQQSVYPIIQPYFSFALSK